MPTHPVEVAALALAAFSLICAAVVSRFTPRDNVAIAMFATISFGAACLAGIRFQDEVAFIQAGFVISLTGWHLGESKSYLVRVPGLIFTLIGISLMGVPLGIWR